MKESKGWEFLTAFEEIDEKYIYQAAKPWKENKIVIVQHYIRGVAACILLVAVIGVGLIHQKMGLRFLWRRLLRMKKVSGLHIL